MVTTSASRSSVCLVTGSTPAAAATPGSGFWLQAITRMPKPRPDPGPPLAQVSQADHAQGGSGQVGADGQPPGPGPDTGVLLGDVPGHAEDQRPGQLGGRFPAAPGPAHRDS